MHKIQMYTQKTANKYIRNKREETTYAQKSDWSSY